MSFAAMLPFLQQPRLLFSTAGVADADTMIAAAGGTQTVASLTFGVDGGITYLGGVGAPPQRWSLDAGTGVGPQCEIQATVTITNRSAIQSSAVFFGETIPTAVGVPHDTAWYGLEAAQAAQAMVAIPFGGHFIYTSGTIRIRVKGLPSTEISRAFICESG